MTRLRLVASAPDRPARVAGTVAVDDDGRLLALAIARVPAGVARLLLLALAEGRAHTTRATWRGITFAWE